MIRHQENCASTCANHSSGSTGQKGESLRLTADNAETSETREVESRETMPTDAEAEGETPEGAIGGGVDIATQRTEMLRSPM